jgi:methanogen homocitrate synthase
MTKKLAVSHFNMEPEVTAAFGFPPHIELHDTTLRDGEQHGTAFFSPKDKVAIAAILDEMGVARIEAGMPASSEQDQVAIREIAKNAKRSKVFALVRSRIDDVDKAVELGVRGVCIEMVVNEALASIFGWSMDEAIEKLLEACAHAKSQGLFVNAFMIDTTRAKLSWILEFGRRVHEAGMVDSLTVVDTIGGCGPEAMRWLVGQVQQVWPGALEVHAHNDFGLGAATSLAALSSGCSAAHVSMNGLGERSGNAPLEQLAIALEELYGQRLGMNLTMLKKLADEVERRSGVRRAENQPVTGENLYTLQAGVSTYFFLRVWETDPHLMFPIHPDLTGHNQPKVALGKLSGSANVEYWAQHLGLALNPDEVARTVERVKEVAMRESRQVQPDELPALVEAAR